MLKMKLVRDALVNAGLAVDPSKPAPPRVRNPGKPVDLAPGVKIRRRVAA